MIGHNFNTLKNNRFLTHLSNSQKNLKSIFYDKVLSYGLLSGLQNSKSFFNKKNGFFFELFNSFTSILFSGTYMLLLCISVLYVMVL